MTNKGKEKVAILGGGVGSMTTAYELTSDPNWKDKFESITVYQLGWRIGGKGASGRHPETFAIEEHGLHVWLGFYENAFKIIRAAYAELDRPKDTPLATWKDAFKPHNFVGVDEYFDGEWQPWMFEFPTNGSLPGEGGELPSVWDFVTLTAGWLSEFAHKSKPAYSVKATDEHDDIWHWLKGAFEKGEFGVRLAGYELGAQLYATLADKLKKASAKGKQHGHTEIRLILELLDYIETWLARELTRTSSHNLEERRILLVLDMGASIMRGLISAKIWEDPNGFDALDEDFATWLTANKATKVTTDINQNPLLRGLYDFVFAYEDGEFSKPNFATGPALRTIFRMLFTYKGSIFYKMQAGMGDTIFTPLYKVLEKRGVQFKFFHRVRNLGLSEDGAHIETIEMGKQVTLKNDEYDPFIDCVDLACWPNQPNYDQIVEGDLLQQKKINLESFWTPWEYVEQLQLRRRQDFDTVVFGISIGSVPYLCPELVKHNPAWQDMVEHVGSVRTMALQLWLKQSLEELGWEKQSPIMTGYVEPFDTWADMTDLLGRECWTGKDKPESINYFCNAMPGGINQPDDHEAPAAARAALEAAVDKFLAQDIKALWPDADTTDGNRLDPESIISLYMRANIDPSERYALSLAGSTQFRLRANESGFDNLFLTGDWIRNDFNAGCVEAATMGGMQCANAIFGRPLNKGVVM